jgi:hypothetical protein
VAANLVQGRCLVDPAVSFADRELELAYMQLSNSLSAELLDAYLAAWPPDPRDEQRRPRSSCTSSSTTSATSGPDRYVPRIEAVLEAYGW